jgi:hypothetical protein
LGSTCTNGVCQGCFGPQFSCTADNQCCSGNCVEVATGPDWCDCVPNGWQCDDTSQCCPGNICTNGRCLL